MYTLRSKKWKWIQHQLFIKIRDQIETSSHFSFPEVIQSLLNIKKSSAYNKIRGRTPLRIDEVILLIEHFEINLIDLIKENTNTEVYPKLNSHKYKDMIR